MDCGSWIAYQLMGFDSWMDSYSPMDCCIYYYMNILMDFINVANIGGCTG